jgi:hypothetical protein
MIFSLFFEMAGLAIGPKIMQRYIKTIVCD